MPRVSAVPRRVVIDDNDAPRIGFVPASSARVLATIGPDDPAWKGEHPACPPGAIVRIRPPASASDADVARVQASLERAGASRARVEARAAGADVLPRKAERAPAERRTIREVVIGMAGEARSEDRGALVAFLDEVLSEEGI